MRDQPTREAGLFR